MTHMEGHVWMRLSGNGKRRYYYRRKHQFIENGIEVIKDVRVSLGSNLERAVQEARKRDEQHDSTANGERAKRDTTLQAFSDWYVAHARDERRLLGWKTIRGAVKALLAHFGDVPLRRITRPEMERFLNRRRGEVRAATANANLRDAKRMFNVAIDEGCLEVNPACRVKILRVERMPVRLPTSEEVGLLLDHLRFKGSWQYPLVMFLIGTGCRLGEALGLEWSDIDFTREVVNLRRRKVNDILPIPLKGPLKAGLWEMWVERGMPKTGRVLFNAEGKPLSRFTGLSAFKRASARVGMPWLTLKTFRKFAATTIVEKTGDIRQAQHLLGHTTIRTTELYLGRVSESRMRAADTMADLLTELSNGNCQKAPEGACVILEGTPRGTKSGTRSVPGATDRMGEDKKTIV